MKQAKKQPPNYQDQIKQNEQLFYALLERVRPDLFVLADVIDTNQINVFILLQFIKHLLKVSLANGTGRIHVFVQESKVTRIEGIDTQQFNENVTMHKQTAQSQS